MKPIFLAIIITVSWFMSPLVSADERPLISVSAEGLVKTKADMALVHLNIDASELDAASARSKTDEQVKHLLALLKSFELKDGSLDSSQTTIYTEYDYNVKPKQLLAYRANRTISFSLTNLKQLEKLVKSISEIQLVTLNRIQFSVQDERYWEDAALSNALQLAKSKAELIAEELGVELRGLYRVTHQVSRSAPPVLARAMSMEMDKSSSNTYQQKDLELTAFVDVSFNFK